MRNVTFSRRLESIRCEIARRSRFLESLAGTMPVEFRELRWQGAPMPAACNGHTLYFNPEFDGVLTDEQVVVMYAHELGHRALMHHWTRNDRRPGRWNRAGDYVINLRLDEMGYAVRDFCPFALIDDRFQGMTTGQVYDRLERHPVDDAEHEFANIPTGITEQQVRAEIRRAAEADPDSPLLAQVCLEVPGLLQCR